MRPASQAWTASARQLRWIAPYQTTDQRTTINMPTKGFFRSLFDLSFTSMVTTTVMKLIYVLSLIFVALIILAATLAAFHQSSELGALTLLVIAPVASLAWIVFIRMALEFRVALFRVMETNAELVWLKRQQLGIADERDRPSAAGTASSAVIEPQPVRYQVGDVVNGHRFNGEAWVPVAAH